MTALDHLRAHWREIMALRHAAGLLSWDQETMMAPGGGAQRAAVQESLATVIHRMETDPRIPDWLATAEPAHDRDHAELREMRRAHDRASRVPSKLAGELARVTAAAQAPWAAARADSDFASFAPILADVVKLKRAEAACLSPDAPYDGLLQDYEPGATAAGITPLFDDLRRALVALGDQVAPICRQDISLTGTFPRADQLDLARDVAARFGYDFDRGRLDLAVHPFSSGHGDDVRITTRVDQADPLSCLYATIHETGHAVYEQGVDAALGLGVLGRGASMGLHESQSRLFENQIGRSRSFAGWLHGALSDRFGDLGLDEDRFHGLVNRVHPGFIRVESDEVHYNLHILMRFDLERDLINAKIDVQDLEEAWNTRFQADFGQPVPDAAHGVLQDVHWPVGLFGYFPTYTLGNLYAGGLAAAMRADLPDLDRDLSAGEPSTAVAWLRDKVHRHGATCLPRDLYQRVTGQDLSIAPLIAELTGKFVV